MIQIHRTAPSSRRFCRLISFHILIMMKVRWEKFVLTRSFIMSIPLCKWSMCYLSSLWRLAHLSDKKFLRLLLSLFTLPNTNQRKINWKLFWIGFTKLILQLAHRLFIESVIYSYDILFYRFWIVFK